MKSIVHPSVEVTLDSYKKTLPQGSLLTGTPGVGLLTIAHELAGAGLSSIVTPTNTDDEPDALYGSISVDDVRRLYESMQSKSSKRRVVIIDDINRMTRQAQNAFLKLLEEPPANVHFIATAHQTDTILPTIRSRLQTIAVPNTTPEQDAQLLRDASYPATELKQIQFIAAGKPAELYRLTHDRTYFETIQAEYSKARSFMSGSMYQRIVVVSQITGRVDALRFIDSVTTVLRAALHTSPRPEFITFLEKLLRTREHILANGNVKLWLLAAVV